MSMLDYAIRNGYSRSAMKRKLTEYFICCISWRCDWMERMLDWKKVEAPETAINPQKLFEQLKEKQITDILNDREDFNV